jgi:hypothetical protein
MPAPVSGLRAANRSYRTVDDGATELGVARLYPPASSCLSPLSSCPSFVKSAGCISFVSCQVTKIAHSFVNRQARDALGLVSLQLDKTPTINHLVFLRVVNMTKASMD